MGASWGGFVVEQLLVVAPERRLVVYPGDETYPAGNDVLAIPLPELARMLAEAGA